MIRKETMEDIIFKTIKKSSCYIPRDVHNALKKAGKSAKSEKGKSAFSNLVKSLELSIERDNPACPDTGWPLFFYKIGNEAKIEGGILELEEISRKMVTKATKEGYLRSTMKHPLTGYDPGGNVGLHVPHFDYKFVPGKDIQVTYVAKGGGSECFGGQDIE